MTQKKPAAEKKKVGRPLRYKTPEDLRIAIENFFTECEKNLDIPLLGWMQHKLQIRLYDYEQRPEFSPVITWAREESEFICEQKAFKGMMSKVAARLYLNCKCGYVQQQKVQVESTSKVSLDQVQGLLNEVDNLDPEKQKYFDELLRKRVERGENS